MFWTLLLHAAMLCIAVAGRFASSPSIQLHGRKFNFSQVGIMRINEPGRMAHWKATVTGKRTRSAAAPLDAEF